MAIEGIMNASTLLIDYNTNKKPLQGNGDTWSRPHFIDTEKKP
jgi:hypothetical protein